MRLYYSRLFYPSKRRRILPEGLRGIAALLRAPLADASAAGLTELGARDALAVVSASYEHSGGFRLRTLTA